METILIQIKNELISWSPLIITIATIFMAIFTGVLLSINRRQHKLNYKQELHIHSCKPTFSVVQRVEKGKEGDIIEKGNKTIESQIGCVLVNSSALPLVIKHINVWLEDKKGRKLNFVNGFIHEIATTEDLYQKGKPAIPEERPARLYISAVPWVIAANDFAIFSYKYTSIPMEFGEGAAFRIKFIYYNEYKKQDTTIETRLDLPIVKKFW